MLSLFYLFRGDTIARTLVPALPPSSFATLFKLLNLSVPNVLIDMHHLEQYLAHGRSYKLLTTITT